MLSLRLLISVIAFPFVLFPTLSIADDKAITGDNFLSCEETVALCYWTPPFAAMAKANPKARDVLVFVATTEKGLLSGRRALHVLGYIACDDDLDFVKNLITREIKEADPDYLLIGAGFTFLATAARRDLKSADDLISAWCKKDGFLAGCLTNASSEARAKLTRCLNAFTLAMASRSSVDLESELKEFRELILDQDVLNHDELGQWERYQFNKKALTNWRRSIIAAEHADLSGEDRAGCRLATKKIPDAIRDALKCE